MKVTMQDIADALGITKVSVSKALNKQPGVSDALRSQILETAEKMGYVRSKGLGSLEPKHFAFIVPKRFFLETEKFYTLIYYYLNKICINAGHRLTSVVLNVREERENIFPSALHPEGIDGFFVAGEIREDYLMMLHDTRSPLVAIDFYKVSLDINYILADNYYLGFYAASYLIKNGHKNIGFVGDIHHTASINDRYFGYVKALKQHGLPIRHEWNLVNNDPLTGVYQVDIRLPEYFPTAFVCHCDMAAYFLSQSLKQAGLRIPEDVSLISFDNTELSQMMIPHLTSFEIGKSKIASMAYEIMAGLVSGEKKTSRFYVSAHLVERDSVAEVPHSLN